MSGGHLCEAEALTEAGAETFASRFFSATFSGGATPPLQHFNIAFCRGDHRSSAEPSLCKGGRGEAEGGL